MAFTPRVRAAAVVALLAAIVAGAGVTAYLATAARPAPAVAYTLLDGTRLNTRDLQGKVVLVNFWASRCTVCVHEMPPIVASHERFRARGYDTLAVAIQYEPPALVVDFAQRRGLRFGVAIDNTGAIARSYADIPGTPTRFLIDRRGRIVERYVGAPDFEALQRRIDALLNEA